MDTAPKLTAQEWMDKYMKEIRLDYNEKCKFALFILRLRSLCFVFFFFVAINIISSSSSEHPISFCSNDHSDSKHRQLVPFSDDFFPKVYLMIIYIPP
jgi:hypothetical protein